MSVKKLHQTFVKKKSPKKRVHCDNVMKNYKDVEHLPKEKF